MKNCAILLFLSIFALALVTPVVGQIYPENTVTITGEVTSDGELITGNGERCFVTEDDMGTDLMEFYAGHTVKVLGTIKEEGDEKTMIVYWFTPAER